MFSGIFSFCKKNISSAIFGLLFISLLLTFISSSWSRVFFFLSSYISILSIIINYKEKPNRVLLFISISLILIGLSKYLWFLLEYVGNPDYNKYNSYFNTGQRLILSGIIAYALSIFKKDMTTRKAKIIEATIIVSFIIATITGLYQSFYNVNRIDFYLGFATDSAYMYSTLSICSIIYLSKYKLLPLRIIVIVLLFLSLFLIFKTGTRNILISYPIILLISFFVWNKNSIRNVFFIIGLMMISFLMGYNHYIKPKIDTTVSEINLYKNSNGNNFGSLTSRLAMWEVGYRAFKNAPFGMSLESRNTFFKEDIKKTNRNRTALKYTNVHLHNEIIETASLQGIFGIIALFITYIILFTAAIKEKNNALLGTVLTIIFVGLSDVVFISREQTIFFSIMIILISMHECMTKKRKD